LEPDNRSVYIVAILAIVAMLAIEAHVALEYMSLQNPQAIAIDSGSVNTSGANINL
jgi:hypothetical protein